MYNYIITIYGFPRDFNTFDIEFLSPFLRPGFQFYMKQFLDFAYSLINYFRIFKVFSFLFLWMIKLCSDSLYILASPWQQRGVSVESVHFGKIKKSRSFANKKQ